MNEDQIILRDVEIVEVCVDRQGNLEETSYVGWKTNDGEAKNGTHFIGGEGKKAKNNYIFIKSFKLVKNKNLKIQILNFLFLMQLKF